MYYVNVSVSCESAAYTTYLDAVITVGEVLHRLKLLVDNTNAGFVCSVHHTLNVLCGLAHSPQFLVEALGGLDGRLRMELSCGQY